ncbi:MAG: hypothetical protein EBS12_04195 [Flavobacteriia bacterium]|nr:hypothetical protein [Flavobacteriia bacterium]
MNTITIGIIREGKVPPDFRVPLTPKQCNEIQTRFPNVKVLVQTSPIRTFKDEVYQKEGIEIVENLSVCDIIFGVKEVPISYLIENKTFFFFSHTIKKQPYNRELLRALLRPLLSDAQSQLAKLLRIQRRYLLVKFRDVVIRNLP